MKKGKQGFASMDPYLRRKVSSRGGKRAHETGKAYVFDPVTAKAASDKASEARTRKALERRALEESRNLTKHDDQDIRL